MHELKVSNCKLIPSESHHNATGQLFVFENIKTIPFEIKRVFYIANVKGTVTRGVHANIKTQMYLFCIKGSCKFLLDDGKNKEIVELNNPEIGLYIGTYVWREMFDFSGDCILMVLASEFYDANEYIRNYEDFLKIAKK